MDEGTIIIGDSQEDVGYDEGTELGVLGNIAERALASIPALATLRVVRAWGALRVMSPDGFPLYQQSASSARSHSACTAASPSHRFTPMRSPTPSRSARSPKRLRLSMKTGSRFKPLETAAAPYVEFEFDGHRIRAPRGISVAAALLRAGFPQCRVTPVSGAPRGPYCLMGACFECVVEIEGLGARQACLLEATDGLRVRPGRGK
jgi:hypothetical protein